MSDKGEVAILVGGMTCQHCVSSVRKALSALPGVKGVEVDLAKGRVVVKGDELDTATLKATIEDLGFDAG